MLKIFSRTFWAELISKRLDDVKSGDIELFLRIFNDYFFRFKRHYIGIFIFILLASATTVAPVFILEAVVDSIFIEKNTTLIIPIFLVTVGLFVVKGASTYLQTILSSRIANAMVADIQQRMFTHILRQKTDFFSRNGSDELLMKFNQGAQGFHSILTTVLVNGSRETITLIFFFATMLYYDVLLTLISFTVTPLVFIGINRLLKKIKEVSRLELAGLTHLNKHVRETVQGISVIKSFNLEKPLKGQMKEVVSNIQKRKNKIARLQAIPSPLLDTIGGIAVGVTLLYAGFRTTSGGYSPATFMAFIGALLLTADSARKFSQMPVRLKTAFVAVSMVFQLLNSNQTEESGEQKLDLKSIDRLKTLNGSAAHPLITFSDVHFAYDAGGARKGNAPVLDGFSLEVRSGEMVALVGPSGAGKSTVLKLLLKLHEPTSGEILIDGQRQQDLELTSLRDAMSFVGQSNFIFSGSIKDNLTLKKDDIDLAVIEEACKKVGMHDFISQMPKGYDTDVGELGSMISGGQAQRLNMARAIIKDAPILLLDEVTSALDAENEQLIKDYVHSQIGRKTIIVIAHRLSTIKDATKIALVSGGKVIDIAPHEQLLASNKYYEKIVALQFAQ